MAALASGEVSLLILVLGVLVLLGAAYAAWLRKIPEAVVIAVVGVVLIMLAS